MKASELIKMLQERIEQYGDLEVRYDADVGGLVKVEYVGLHRTGVLEVTDYKPH
jgi:hypothetical protein